MTVTELKKSSAPRFNKITLNPAIALQAAVVKMLPQAPEMQQITEFINDVLSVMTKAVKNYQFSHSNRPYQVDKFNDMLNTALTGKIAEFQKTLKRGLTLNVRYNDSEKQRPSSIYFTDKKGRKQGPALNLNAQFVPHIMCVTYAEFKNNRLTSMQDYKYDALEHFKELVEARRAQVKDPEDDIPLASIQKPEILHKTLPAKEANKTSFLARMKQKLSRLM